MGEDQLEVTIREAQNGWVVELNREGETMEYIFTRPNPAINLVRKVMKGEVDPFNATFESFPHVFEDEAELKRAENESDTLGVKIHP